MSGIPDVKAPTEKIYYDSNSIVNKVALLAELRVHEDCVDIWSIIFTNVSNQMAPQLLTVGGKYFI